MMFELSIYILGKDPIHKVVNSDELHTLLEFYLFSDCKITSLFVYPRPR